MKTKLLPSLSLLLAILLLFFASLSISYPLSERVGFLTESVPTLHGAFHGAALGKHTPQSVSKSNPNTAEQYRNLSVYVGGMPFGIKFLTEGVIIMGFHSVQSKNKTCTPAADAGLRVNDVILQINGTAVSGGADLSRIVEESEGKILDVVYSRGGVKHKTKITPAYFEAEGRYSTGIYVRDSGAGIGTVTFILPQTGAFAGLGHGVCDGETGALIPMQRGSVVDVTISGVVRGLAGSPGEVKGRFCSGKLGTLLGNTECGVYGVLAKMPSACPQKTTKIALRDEVREGTVQILCTVNGSTPKAYTAEISQINPDATGNKCFTVKITDPSLISQTGGIIQGFSGSPILQDGRLIGAVTHVLINDPTAGYGIFVENMLNQMGELAS